MKPTKEQEKQQKTSSKDILAKGLFVFARFSWFFGIIITIIVFFSLYRFIIQPQYEKLLQRQSEIEQLNLEGERTALANHVKKLQAFIQLSGTITQEDKNNLDTLLQDVPDTLVLQIQFEKFLEEYAPLESSIEIGEPTYETMQGSEEAPASTRTSIIDLSSFFEDEGIAPPRVNNANDDTVPTIVLGTIPLDMTVSFNDYFAAKDFLRDLEKRVPLIDITTLQVTVEQEVTSAVTGDDAGSGASTPVEEGAVTTLTLTGTIHIASQQ